MPKGLPPKGLFKKITSKLRAHGKAYARLPSRGVWLLGLALFLTSVTIAAIIPRGGDTPTVTALVPSTPPQTVQLGDAPVPPAAIAIESTPAGTQTVRETPDRERWTEVTIRKGDTLSDILDRHGHDGGPVYRLIRSNPEARTFRHLLPGQTLRLRADADGTLQELVYETGPGEAFHLARHDDHFELTKELRTF